jgi:hypothetical protein
LQRAVVRPWGRRGDLGLRQLAHEVGAADHANEAPVGHHGHLPDAICVENVGDLSEARALGDRDDEAGHDILGAQPVALDVLPCLRIRIGEQLQPPFAPLLRADLAAVREIGLAHDTEKLCARHDGHGADAVADEDCGDLADGRIWGRPSPHHGS